MRIFFRLFFKTVRLIVGPFLLLWEFFASLGGTKRDAAAQARLDEECRHLILYQFKTCPFCVKVRIRMARLSLNIEKRDAQHNQQYRDELEQGGGQIKVPCLKITSADGDVTWMYESDEIIRFLEAMSSAP